MKVFFSIYVFWIDHQSASTTAKTVIQTQLILLIRKINSGP